MSDLGSHWNDLPFWALDLDAPLTIEAHTGKTVARVDGAWIDEQGALYLAGVRGAGVIDDRDLGAVSSMLEDRCGDPLDPEFDWAAAAPGDARLRLGAARCLEVGRVVRAALGDRFGFVSDPAV